MTVYIEYVLIDNALIDCLLIFYTYKLLRLPLSKIKLIISSILGGIFALIFPLFSLPKIFSIACKVVFGLIIEIIPSKIFTFKTMTRLSVCFYLLSFLTGGALMGIESLLNVNSGQVFLSIYLVTIYLIVFLVEKAFNVINKSIKQENFTYRVRIETSKTPIEVLGFLDSGNFLFYKNQPLIVIDYSLFNKLIKSNEDLKRADIRQIEVSSVNGLKKKNSFIIEKMDIYFREQWNTYNNVRAIVGQTFGKYKVILNLELMGDDYENNANKKSEKTIKKTVA